jgi:hypothetical protein
VLPCPQKMTPARPPRRGKGYGAAL